MKNDLKQVLFMFTLVAIISDGSICKFIISINFPMVNFLQLNILFTKKIIIKYCN